MLHDRRLFPLILFALLALSAPVIAAAAQTAAAAKANEEQPPYQEYKGVRIGMPVEEARKKLGAPADKGDKQDFYVFSDNESAQVFYDGGKVHAVSVIYVGNPAMAPTAKSVLGSDIEAKPDGSMHRKVDFPKAGFWVSYSRTAGDAPLVTVTMMKMPQR
jgi:hypothetical protein